MKIFFKLFIEMFIIWVAAALFQKESLMILTGHWLSWL